MIGCMGKNATEKEQQALREDVTKSQEEAQKDRDGKHNENKENFDKISKLLEQTTEISKEKFSELEEEVNILKNDLPDADFSKIDQEMKRIRDFCNNSTCNDFDIEPNPSKTIIEDFCNYSRCDGFKL